MNKNTVPFLLSFLLATMMPVYAGSSSQKDAQEHDCSYAKTQTDMDTCRESAYKTAKQSVSTLVTKISKSYTANEPRLTPLFQMTQKKWYDYIKAQCEFENYYSRGGAGYNAYYLSCMERYTIKRKIQLKKILANP